MRATFVAALVCLARLRLRARHALRRRARPRRWHRGRISGRSASAPRRNRASSRPASAPPASACPRRADTAACSVDGDCRSREKCLCGRCAVAVCDSADECGPPTARSSAPSPTAAAIAPAPSTATARAASTASPAATSVAAAARPSADCQRGESCQSSTGLCITTACAGDADCGGRTCLVERTGALLAEPSPLVTADGVELWLERTDDDGVARIWHGRSSDGLAFVLDAAAALDGAAPSVARLADGSLALVFANGASLFAARSPDGAAWSTPTPALPNARQPSLVVQPDGTPTLYAVDPDGNITRFTGSAELVFSTPLVALTPSSAATPLWPDIDTLASPFVEQYVDADGSLRLRLWFAAHGTESGPSSQFGVPTPTPPDYSIGVAVSADTTTFQPDAYDPVFDRTTDFINHPSELDPAVVSLGDHWLLYYRRAKPDGSAGETLAVAISPLAPK